MPLKRFITPLDEFDASRLTFSQVKEQNHGAKFIYINYDNGVDQGPLRLHLQDYFCFGVDANYAPNDKQKQTITGYKLPIPMWGTTSKTDQQAKLMQVLQAVAERCAEFLCKAETRKLLKKPELTKDFVLAKFMPLWYKRNDDMEIIEESAPVLYAKLMTKGESPNFTITTRFEDSDGAYVDPMSLAGKMFAIDGALLKIESIFIGAAPKLQMKIEEVVVQAPEEEKQPLILRGPVMKKQKVEDALEYAPAADPEPAAEEFEAPAELENDPEPAADMPLFDPTPAPGTRKRKQL